MKLAIFSTLAFSCAALLAPTFAVAKTAAQAYPAKPVRVIVPWPIGGTPAQFGAYLSRELDKWGKVIRAANIRLD